MVESSRLPHPIFSPATKAETGHDENIDFKRCAQIIGLPLAEKVRDISLALYSFARDYAAQRGIIIADTKFEFGLTPAVTPSELVLSEAEGRGLSSEPQLVLIDEALTPDSSRFWPAD